MVPGRLGGLSLGVLTAAVVASCEVPRTQLAVGVDTELTWGAGGMIQSVSLEVRRGDGTGALRSRRSTALGSGNGRASLPLWVTVVSIDDDDPSPLWIEALGCSTPDGCTRDTAVVSQRAAVRFVPGATAMVRLLLAGRCVSRSCALTERCAVATGECIGVAAQDEVSAYGGRLPGRWADASVALDATVADAPGADALGVDAATDQGLPVDAMVRPDASVADAGDATVADVAPSDALGVDATPDQGMPVDAMALPDAIAADAMGCAAGTHLCGGSCVSDTAVSSCGASCAPCTVPTGGSATCVGGACGTSCPTGGTLCAAGCVSVASDPANCGTCGNACPAGQSCSSGVCGTVCPVGMSLCGAACESLGGGCTSAGSGGCATAGMVVCTSGSAACSAAPRTSGACTSPVNGTCNTSGSCVCAAGTHLCSGACLSDTAVSSCGSSCTPCPGFANGSATCVSGACGGACAVGFGDCDGVLANGCEVNTASGDVTNCGACGTRCPAPPAGTSAVCAVSTCGISSVSCPSDRRDCDGVPTNGCERTVLTDVNNCGACGVRCSAAGGTPGCAGGVCTITCATGFGNCDGNVASGCEVDLRANFNNCGACSNSCLRPPNAAPACVSSACGMGACDMGFGNCNGTASDGCEVILASSNVHCGACDRACSVGSVCISGSCMVIGPPRPIAPLSTATVTVQRPTLRWALAAGTDGARVQVCVDRACATIEQTLDAVGTSTVPAMALIPGVHFWRLVGRAGPGVFGATMSPTWEFVVGARNAPVDTSSGTMLDVNGDGYADLVVGAAFAAPGGRVEAGSASVYLGGATGFGATPARVFEGAVQSDKVGVSVASAGDVNGDGYADLVIGALSANTGRRSGTASVYLGGAAGLGATPARVLENAASDASGISVASAGDVNGDGYADVVIGARWASPGGRRYAGTASVYLGSASGLGATPAWVLEGAAAGDLFASVASAGDVNGDGYGDLVVGAIGADPGGLESAGTASVYLGGAAGLGATPARLLEGAVANDQFGGRVANAGDVNGDGYSDLVVGARYADPSGRSNAGTASVYLGGAAGLGATPVHVLGGVAVSDQFGSSVASAGDVNGDGYADLVVGAAFADPGGRMTAGTASVYLGTAAGLRTHRKIT